MESGVKGMRARDYIHYECIRGNNDFYLHSATSSRGIRHDSHSGGRASNNNGSSSSHTNASCTDAACACSSDAEGNTVYSRDSVVECGGMSDNKTTVNAVNETAQPVKDIYKRIHSVFMLRKTYLHCARQQSTKATEPNASTLVRPTVSLIIASWLVGSVGRLVGQIAQR